MKIKLTESQLINIIKEEDISSVDALGKLLDKIAFLSSDADAKMSDEEKQIFLDLIDNGQINPNFNPETATPESLTKIDILPLEKTSINSPYGPRNIGGNASKDHKGVDLKAKSGTEVYSVANGTVKAARDTTPNGCGGFVKIDHGEYQTKYCHLKKWSVKKGDTVTKGQLIGWSGGDKNDPYKGNSMGAHLHYEVLKGGKHVNPVHVHNGLA